MQAESGWRPAPLAWRSGRPASAVLSLRPAAGARPLVIGHRGAAALAPPNSAAAFAAAAAAGADLVELDVGPGLLVGHPRERSSQPPLALPEALALLASQPLSLQLDVKARA